MTYEANKVKHFFNNIIIHIDFTNTFVLKFYRVILLRILYDSKNTEYKKPFGALKKNEQCRITVKIPSECKTVQCFLCAKNANNGKSTEFDLKLEKCENLYDIYSVNFSLSEIGLYYYHFRIITEWSEFTLYKFGRAETNIEDGRPWQITCYAEDFRVDKSFMGKVMYQIFPDRFYRDHIADTKGKLEPYRIHTDTNDIPDYLPDENGKILNCDFFGGNLDGIIKKLDYIKSLGTSIIYLNPIFKAYSNHRYDTCDYMKIDPLLGDENDFKLLCEKAHETGIKIILDGVFSHTGSDSIYFDKNHIFGTGSCSNPDSEYKSWYNFEHFPDKYDSWWGIDTLPCVNELDKSYVNYIINDSDSVIAHYLNLGADGFRLDVADELPDEFIYLLRKRVKEIKPDGFVIGEVWEDASNKISYGKVREYFSNGELDSVMNYVFKDAIISFVLNKINCDDFADTIMTIAENYPHDALHSLMNSLSTHDTARILTVLSETECPGDKRDAANFRLNGELKLISEARLCMAAFLQYTLPGNACIYYGDEIGMEGFGDPFNRGYFKWDNINERLKYYFSELGKVKNKYKALQIGDIVFENCKDALIFERKAENETVKAIINRGRMPIEIKEGRCLTAYNVSDVGKKKYVLKDGFALTVSNI